MIAVAPQQIRDICASLGVGQKKLRCPMCQGTRRKNNSDRPLSVKVDGVGVQYTCHHCGENGGWAHKETRYTQHPIKRERIRVDKTNGKTPNKTAMSYMIGRGISEDVLTSHAILDEYSFAGSRLPAVGFPYRNKSGDVTSIKWRSADQTKRFSQQNVCEDFFNIEKYTKGDDLLVCEGEVDALSWMSADLPSGVTVVSIPNGAPPKVKDGRIDPADDNKFRYIWRAKDKLDSAGRIIINTDLDSPGDALKEELLRRIGRSKVWTVSLGKHKDASEALMAEGVDYLTAAFEDAAPLPAVGLHNAQVYDQSYTDLYEKGQARGASTGIPSLDKLIQVPTGMLTVVTGFPSSGKSDLVDQICLNLAKSNEWKTVYCSFEKPPELHMAQLAQKIIGKPFFDGSVEKMDTEERDFAFQWIKEHFLFMDYRRDGPTNIEGILDVASAAVMRMGCRILVIDPYNYIDVGGNLRETDAISQMLTQVQLWAKEHDAHVFFVAHPTKISPDRRSERKTIVTGHDIAGSAAWFAKADIGLSAWRHQRDEEPPEAHIWKVRWSWLGKNGSCPLSFEKATGRWRDYDYQDDYDWDF